MTRTILLVWLALALVPVLADDADPRRPSAIVTTGAPVVPGELRTPGETVHDASPGLRSDKASKTVQQWQRVE